jgi:hypothetical protein
MGLRGGDRQPYLPFEAAMAHAWDFEYIADHLEALVSLVLSVGDKVFRVLRMLRLIVRSYPLYQLTSFTPAGGKQNAFWQQTTADNSYCREFVVELARRKIQAKSQDYRVAISLSRSIVASQLGTH